MPRASRQQGSQGAAPVPGAMRLHAPPSVPSVVVELDVAGLAPPSLLPLPRLAHAVGREDFVLHRDAGDEEHHLDDAAEPPRPRGASCRVRLERLNKVLAPVVLAEHRDALDRGERAEQSGRHDESPLRSSEQQQGGLRDGEGSREVPEPLDRVAQVDLCVEAVRQQRLGSVERQRERDDALLPARPEHFLPRRVDKQLREEVREQSHRSDPREQPRGGERNRQHQPGEEHRQPDDEESQIERSSAGEVERELVLGAVHDRVGGPVAPPRRRAPSRHQLYLEVFGGEQQRRQPANHHGAGADGEHHRKDVVGHARTGSEGAHAEGRREAGGEEHQLRRQLEGEPLLVALLLHGDVLHHRKVDPRV
mmetsp:Transcript_8996/g.28451  ORF Transcript_8996/g.28451 Transcript_8996/m.28451 type:complete len:365 (-) Transcript_8996:285-1379(-)